MAEDDRVDDPFDPRALPAEAFRRAAREGAAFVPRAVRPPFIRRLVAEFAGLRFEPAPAEVGEVRQETEACTLPQGLAGFPATASLGRALVAAARASGVRGLRTWRPKDVVVQRYAPDALGITSHRDGKRFRRLVAVVTLEGRARFATRRDRHGDVVARWDVGPGDLVLMRGPGLAGARDGRPFHEVSGPREGARSSVAFRMDAGRR
jgi:hypothetical protein